MAQHRVAPVLPAGPQLEHGRAVVHRRAEAVDAATRDATMITSRRSNSAWVAAWRSRSISSFRDESFSMYVSDRGQVGLGLVVVEVADEVLDRVVREELAELGVQLGGQRLVVGEDQRRLVVARR